MVKIVWTEISLEDLRSIRDYIAQDSKRYATITIDRIYQRSRLIKNNPLIGRIVPEFNNKNIKELIIGNYRLVYRIMNENKVEIVRIYHSSRLLKEDAIE